ICDMCQRVLKLGSGGIENYETQHKGSPICKKTREKLLNAPPLKNVPKPIPDWARPKQHLIPPLASTSVPQIRTTAAQDRAESSPTRQPSIALAKKLKRLADGLDKTVPEATANDYLAILAQDPKGLDRPDVASVDLWQVVLNDLLKNTLGWGMERPVKDVLRRGRFGVEGLVWLVDYFVGERGVAACLFEGKLGLLIEEMENRPTTPAQGTANDQAPIPSVDPILSPAQVAMPTHSPYQRRKPSPVVTQFNGGGGDGEIEVIVSMPAKNGSEYPCPGYRLDVPEGKSPHTSYPFALHACTSLPWNYGVREGTMFLTSHSCKRSVGQEDEICQSCAALGISPIIRGIVDRMNNGTHINTAHSYCGIDELLAVIRRSSEENQYLRFHTLNQARSILRKSAKISEHNRLIAAIASGDIARIDRVVHVALKQRRGVVGILEQVIAAARGVYHVKSFSERERLLATLLWRLGGDRVGHVIHRALALPGVSTLCNGSAKIPLTPSAGKPSSTTVARNMMGVLEKIIELLRDYSGVLHAVLMFDELACEKRIRWNPHTHEFLGVCRQHGPNVALEFNCMADLEELFRALDVEAVHYAANATVGALGLLSRDSRVNAGRVVFISPDCGRETGSQHAAVLKAVYDGVNSIQEKTRIRIVSIASDGESRRGSALVELTFKKLLQESSKIHGMLSPLTFLDLHVGDDDLTCDKDWKHVFKRVRNLLLRDRGVLDDDFRVTPAIIRAHLNSTQADARHVNSVMNPEDLQDVGLAFNLLHDIWALPGLDHHSGLETPSPGFQKGREALQILGKLFRRLVTAYLCVELSLSEQLVHLSAAAHLAFVLYKVAGKSFLPTLLYVDIILMIKNVFFSVAKAKSDNPNGVFFIVLLGTDRLEIHFGILRTVVGNDCNLDILQIADRTSGVHDVADILAGHPEWDQGTKQEIPNSADHLSPKHLLGDYNVQNVTLLTCWRKGRAMAEEEYLPTATVLKEAESKPGVTMLAPAGQLLVTTCWSTMHMSLQRAAIALPIAALAQHRTASAQHVPYTLPSFFHSQTFFCSHSD
ncbi:hypothetical protein FA13DRAFT_1649397, partial [Coprinellus micaceus]